MLRAAVLLLLLALAPHLRAEVVDVGNAELARLLAAGVPVIDIRTAGEWKETGVVPGSRLITLFDERGRADAADWLAKVRAVVKPEQPVILICRSGNRTRAASRLLAEQAGYRTVYNVQDGIRAWAKEGRSLAPLPPTAAACSPGASC